MTWSSLVADALLGTARRGGDPTALLDAAAEASVLRLAASGPSASSDDAQGPLAPAESRPVVPAGARRVLDELLGLADDAGLLRVFLARVEATGHIVPPEHLPELGDVGAAGGERARWLRELTQPPAPEPRDWLTADRRERRAMIEALREHDPKHGRELLESTWAEEPPADRAFLLSALRPGLGPDDEDLLERALRDRRKPVRVAAHELLSRLPESAFGRRMRERLQPLIEADGIALPELRPDWRKDGLEGRTRTALLQQLVAAAPLDTWPEVRVREEVREGLTLATKRQRRADWAAALLSRGDPELLELVPAGDAVWVAIEDADPIARLQLLAVLPGPWPEDFSRDVAAQLRRDTPHLAGRHGVAPLLKHLAAPLHPAAVRDLTKAAERLVHQGGAIGYAAQGLIERLHLRLAIDRELPL